MCTTCNRTCNRTLPWGICYMCIRTSTIMQSQWGLKGFGFVAFEQSESAVLAAAKQFQTYEGKTVGNSDRLHEPLLHNFIYCK